MRKSLTGLFGSKTGFRMVGEMCLPVPKPVLSKSLSVRLPRKTHRLGLPLREATTLSVPMSGESQFLLRREKSYDTERRMRAERAFCVVDRVSSGTVSREDLPSVFFEMGTILSEAQIDELTKTIGRRVTLFDVVNFLERYEEGDETLPPPPGFLESIVQRGKLLMRRAERNAGVDKKMKNKANLQMITESVVFPLK